MGFEPTTRGLKVSSESVHRVLRGPALSMPRVALIHGLHPIGPESTAVAVNVAVSRQRTLRPHGDPAYFGLVEQHSTALPPVLGRRARTALRRGLACVGGHSRRADDRDRTEPARCHVRRTRVLHERSARAACQHLGRGVAQLGSARRSGRCSPIGCLTRAAAGPAIGR